MVLLQKNSESYQAITNFQNIISRNILAMQLALLSCCSIKAGEAVNVILDKLNY